jgi:hypothetical protein
MRIGRPAVFPGQDADSDSTPGHRPPAGGFHNPAETAAYEHGTTPGQLTPNLLCHPGLSSGTLPATDNRNKPFHFKKHYF